MGRKWQVFAESADRRSGDAPVYEVETEDAAVAAYLAEMGDTALPIVDVAEVTERD